MDTLFGILVIWLIFCFVFAEISPILGELFIYLLRFLIECVVIAVITILRIITGAIGYAVRTLWLVISAPFRSRALGDWQEPEPDPEPESETPFRTPYEAACWFLGLQPDSFDRTEFKAAFRRAIRSSHPDAGGDEEHAKTIIRSAEIIRAVHGW